MFGPLIATTITVQCPNPACQSPARATVQLPFAAPGVYARPALHRSSCGFEVEEIHA